METNGKNTRQEIFSQPEAWAGALTVLDEISPEVRRFIVQTPCSQVIFTGCGSTYYLSLAAASLFTLLTGLNARALPASELWLNPQSSYSSPETLLVAISRSGRTSETLNACQAHRQDGRGRILTISVDPETPLQSLGDLNIVLPSAVKKSVAQTRSFSTMFLAATALAAVWAGREDLTGSLTRLPEAGQRVLTSYAVRAAEIGHDASLERFYFLGSAARYGLACELSLKMKEMSISHSEPFHFLEYRHGPMSMANASALITGLLSDGSFDRERRVLDEMEHLGARLLPIHEDRAEIQINSGLPEEVRNILFLPIGQMVALERALARGLNPDQPQNLTVFVKL